MQPKASQYPAALETRVQFTVRSVLLGTTLVAVGVALVAPWFRQWTSEQRAAFLATWCNLAAGAIAAVAVACVTRVRAERRAGAARYRLPSANKTWPTLLMVIIWATLIIGYSLFKTLATSVVAAPWLWFDFVGIQYGVTFALAALGIWWRADCLELCDLGLLRGPVLFPWKAFRGFRWGSFDPNILILQGRFSITTWRVRPDCKAVVDQFLTDHV